MLVHQNKEHEIMNRGLWLLILILGFGCAEKETKPVIIYKVGNGWADKFDCDAVREILSERTGVPCSSSCHEGKARFKLYLSGTKSRREILAAVEKVREEIKPVVINVEVESVADFVAYKRKLIRGYEEEINKIQEVNK